MNLRSFAFICGFNKKAEFDKDCILQKVLLPDQKTGAGPTRAPCPEAPCRILNPASYHSNFSPFACQKPPLVSSERASIRAIRPAADSLVSTSPVWPVMSVRT